MEFVIGAVALLLIAFALYKYYTYRKQRKKENEAAPSGFSDPVKNEEDGRRAVKKNPLGVYKLEERESQKKFTLDPNKAYIETPKTSAEKKRVRARKFGNDTYYYENNRWNPYDPYAVPYLIPVFLSTETVDEEPNPESVGAYYRDVAEETQGEDKYFVGGSSLNWDSYKGDSDKDSGSRSSNDYSGGSNDYSGGGNDYSGGSGSSGSDFGGSSGGSDSGGGGGSFD